jgi:3-methylfumaryl-CoA hydratase
MDIDYLRKWVGRSERAFDEIGATPPAVLAAALDRQEPRLTDGDALPLLRHWLYFPAVTRRSELDPDGHPRRGGFLPPVPLQRRLFAGAKLKFNLPIRIGDNVERTSRVVDIAAKTGRMGDPLLFVRLQREYRNQSGMTVLEDHDIVYRDRPVPGELPAPVRHAPDEHDWADEMQVDPVLLFQYSALTFNQHRIHYDRTYATTEEGYPGLMVHAPLVATLLVDSLRDHLPARRLQTLEFRAVGPLFDNEPFLVCGQRRSVGEARLWAQKMDGSLAMDALATFG